MWKTFLVHPPKPLFPPHAPIFHSLVYTACASCAKSAPKGQKMWKISLRKGRKTVFSPPSPGKKQESNPAWMNIHREMKDFAPRDGKTRPFIPRFSRTQSLMPPWVAGFSTVCTCPTTTTKNNISCHAVSERMIPCCFP